MYREMCPSSVLMILKCPLYYPALTTIRQDTEQLGTVAAETLLTSIEEQDATVQSVIAGSIDYPGILPPGHLGEI